MTRKAEDTHHRLRIDMAKAKAWTAEEVLKRWLRLCPARNGYGKPVVVTSAWIAERAKDSVWIEARRGGIGPHA